MFGYSVYMMSLKKFAWRIATARLVLSYLNILKRVRSLDIRWDQKKGLYSVTSGRSQIYVARRARLQFFHAGIEARQELLTKEYSLNRIRFEQGDLIIDIGANIGEVSHFLAARHGVVPLAFEPDRREFLALMANIGPFGGRGWNELLWFERAIVEFFDGNDTGDSSIFAQKDGLMRELRSATTLDSLLDSAGYSNASVKFMKIEAEGAEPEILDGAKAALLRTEYVAVDVGPERGPKGETTLIPVYERLVALGFSAISFHHKRLVLLFHRDRMTA